MEVLRQLAEGKIEPPRRASPKLAQLLLAMLARRPRDRPRADEVRECLRGHFDEAQAKALLLGAAGYGAEPRPPAQGRSMFKT